MIRKRRFLFAIILIASQLQMAWARPTLSFDEERALSKFSVSKDQLQEMVEKGKIGELKNKIENKKAEIETSILEERERVENQVQEKKDELKAKVDQAVAKGEAQAQAEIDKIKDRLNQKQSQLSERAQKIAKEIEEDATKMLWGYTASSVSLTMIGVFAPSVVMTCKTKPSALLYAGTAAVYVVRELQNSRKFKVSALSEIELVKLKLDKSQPLSSQLATAREAMDVQFEFFNSYKKVLDTGFRSIADKAQNAKMAAIGFGAASGLALAETFAFDAGACLNPDIVWLPPFEQQKAYAQKLAQAKSFTEELALFDEWSRLSRGEKSSVTIDEYQKWQGLGSLSQHQEVFQTLLRLSTQVFFPSAHARDNSQIQSEKLVISQDLKNNKKLADLLSDSDKIFGLLLGGSSVIAAQFIPWWRDNLRKIASSGTMRSILFGAHAGIAYVTASQLEESSQNMLKRLDDVQNILDQVQEGGHKVFDGLESVVNSETFNDIAHHLGYDPNNPQGAELEQSLRDNAKEVGGEALELKLQDFEIEPPKGSFLSDFIFSRAHAATASTFRLRCYDQQYCPPPSYPRFTQGNLKSFNDWMMGYQAYGAAVYQENGPRRQELEQRISNQEEQIFLFREQLQQAVVKKNFGRPIDFNGLEKQEAKRFQNEIAKMVERPNSHVPKPEPLAKRPTQTVNDRPMVASSGGDSFNMKDYQVLMGLIARLEKEKAPAPRSLDHDYNITTIHSKDIPLFEAITRRYQLIFSRRLGGP